ncbi:hypothetical protein AQI95_01555 [Streptomyces yokosukanensis]|uniref:Uncharacterized protein n=1 Tax=Streptomyces yokosukanensis TaxID=67386 RepID=A0A117Q630_9ACTN|nr:hypothetical protein [Streptomyces yokosukanensis]KUN10434.1 hypothetical protein AQI95_01555 [Streptomyces yokosukanensis]
MSSIRRAVACTAASVLLSVGGLALAAPAQADDQAPTASVQQSAPSGLLGNGEQASCGLLGLGCILHGLLGIL